VRRSAPQEQESGGIIRAVGKDAQNREEAGDPLGLIDYHQAIEATQFTLGVLVQAPLVDQVFKVEEILGLGSKSTCQTCLSGLTGTKQKAYGSSFQSLFDIFM